MSDINLREPLSDQQEISIIEEELGDLSPLLSLFPEEALNKLVQNKDKLLKLSKQFSGDISTITTTIMLMKCNSETCPYKSSCPLLKLDMQPEGFFCPVEKKISNELELAVIQSLDIDRQDTMEMELLYDFIDTKLLDMRTSGMLSNISLVQDIDGRNGAYRDVAPEFTIKMELKKLKSEILNEFMSTRASKAKYGIKKTSSMEDIIKSAMTGAL